jgi:adenosylcobinamide-phosphate synthase
MVTVTIPIFLILGALTLLPEILAAAALSYFIYAGLATRALHAESRRVMAALWEGDLPEARARLGMIVSRDTAHLGEAEIRRAVLETVAENLGDGVVAPMFYTLLLGVPGLLWYKTASTMDSMVGYMNDRYRYFGRVAARTDDALNYLPARLTALLLSLAAPLMGLSGKDAWRIARRDACLLKSPNAGWPMAAAAGALGVQLGGDAVYFGKVVGKPILGDPGPALADAHYRGAIFLLYGVSLFMAGLTFFILYLSAAGFWGWLGCR